MTIITTNKAERERLKRVAIDHRDRIMRALRDAGPSGLTIGTVRVRTMLRDPSELLRGLVRDGLAFARPDEGGVSGAFRWFASREWRDGWHPAPKMVAGGALGWGAVRWPRFTEPCRSRLVESQVPDPKPAPVRAGALDFKACPSIGPQFR